MRDEIIKRPVKGPLKSLKPGTVFCNPATGERGYVVRYWRSKSTVHVVMETQGSIFAAPDTQVEIDYDPWELAAAYLHDLSIRMLVWDALMEHGAYKA